MDTKSFDESIISSMDGNNTDLLKYLPYILQDFWEIGTSPELVIKLIKKYKTDYSSLSMLDLGSGKGAVSIKVALELKCKCFGIDAISDFVDFSNNKAKYFSVDRFCSFENADIRVRIKVLGKYDVIILGAIGDVFGNYLETLTTIKPHLNKGGIIIIDDAYVDDNSEKDVPKVLRKKELLNQIKMVGMELIDTVTDDEFDGLVEEFDDQFNNIEKRCLELIEKYPKDKNLFLDYIESQRDEYKILSDDIIPAVFVIKEKE